MLALEAIYGTDDFTRDADGRGFSLRVAAHEGAATAAMNAEEETSASLSGDGSPSSSVAAAPQAARERKAAERQKAFTTAFSNTSAALLCVRYPALYPCRPLKISVKPLEGLPEAAARELARQLSSLAAEAANAPGIGGDKAEKAAAEEEVDHREHDEFDVSEKGAEPSPAGGGEVCAFSLATHAADFLADATLARAPPLPSPLPTDDDEESASAVVASLWDDAMRRTANLAAGGGGGGGGGADGGDGDGGELDGGSEFAALAWGVGGGLFGDEPAIRRALPPPPAPFASSKGGALVAPPPPPPPPARPPPTKKEPPKARPPTPPPAAAPERSISAAIFRSVRQLSQLALGGRTSQKDLQLQQQQREQAEREEEEAEEKEEEEQREKQQQQQQRQQISTGAPNSEAMQALRKDLVLCQALRLAASLGSSAAAAGDGTAASGAAAPPLSQRSLPAVAAELAERGILPSWAAGVLSGPPAALDLALARAFGGGERKEEDATANFLRASARPQRQLQQQRTPDPPPSSSFFSRYAQDFEEIATLGRGGFGVVVSATNKLDGRRYAVKKIPLRSSASPAEAARILREVATLSRLQHNNVVRYFNCWLEDAGPGEEKKMKKEKKEKKKKEKRREKRGKKETQEDEEEKDEGEKKRAERHWLDSSTAGAATARKATAIESEESSSSAAGGGFWQTKPSAASSTTTGTETGTTIEAAAAATIATTATAATATTTLDDDESSGFSSSDDDYDSGSESETAEEQDEEEEGKPNKSKGTRQTLFIQMELCPRTLREVLDGKRSGGAASPSSSSSSPVLDGEGAWRAVRGLLRGLAYLASQGILHRDLKPSNLFISARGDAVLIGDFGLSKSASAADGNEANGGDNESNKDAAIVNNTDASDATGAVGTALYISPEVLEGWSAYDSRVDIWSAGVVAFEVFSGPFATAHERVLALRALRERGGPPPAEEWPSPGRVGRVGRARCCGCGSQARRLDARPQPRRPPDSCRRPPVGPAPPGARGRGRGGPAALASGLAGAVFPSARRSVCRGARCCGGGAFVVVFFFARRRK